MGILLQWKNIEGAVTLLTFNTLAEAFMHQDHYKNFDKHSLSRATRTANVLSWIDFHKPDVICLQEVDAIDDQFSYIGCMQKIGYKIHFIKKRGTSQGQLLAWRKQTIKLLNSKIIFYSEQFIKTLKKQKQFNVGIMALFKLRATERLFTLACSHLYWNPKKQKIKYQELAILLKNYSKYYPHVKSRIICGDLNSQPKSCVLDLLRAKPPQDPQKIHRTIFETWQNFQPKDIYFDAYEDYKEPSNITNKFTGKIDHIWTTGVRVMNRLELNPAWKKESLPNEIFPSDHLPLGIRFECSE